MVLMFEKVDVVWVVGVDEIIFYIEEVVVLCVLVLIDG